MLQLHKTEGGQEYAEFLHAPKRKLTDFGMSTSDQGCNLFPSLIITHAISAQILYLCIFSLSLCAFRNFYLPIACLNDSIYF